MATQNLIQIKRSESTATPTSLANGELAWSGVSDALFIGNFGSVAQIGGLVIDSDTMSGANATNLASAESIKAYVDSVAGAGVSDLNDVSDVNAASATGGHVLTWDGTEEKWVDADLVGGNGINTITYDQATDTHTISVQAANSTISVAAGGIAVNETNLTITESQISDLGSYLTSVSVDGLSDATVTSVTDNELLAYDSGTSQWINQTPAEAGFAASATTDTTDASNITSGTLASARLPDLAVSDFGGAAIVIESEGINSSDNDTSIPTSAAVKDFVEGKGYSTTTGTVTSVSGTGSVNGITLSGTVTSAGSLTLGGTLSGITVSQLAGAAVITAGETLASNDSDTAVPTAAAVIDYVDAQVTAQDLDITDGTTTSAIDLDSQTMTIQGTSNEVEVGLSGQTFTVGLPNDVTIGQDLTVTGNLVVQGTTTTIDTTQLLVEDNLIRLATNNSADTTDFGLYGVYNDGAEKYAGIVRDASDSGTFKLLEGITSEPTGTAVTGGTLAALDVGALSAASLALTSPLNVSNGGTGRNTLTDNAVLVGDGTNPVELVSGNAYEVLQLDASGVPGFGTLDGGTF